MHQATAQLLQRYYDAFNAGDMVTFLSLLTDDVIHDINQSGREMGKPAFEQFMQRMNRNYREKIVDLSITTNEAGDRPIGVVADDRDPRRDDPRERLGPDRAL